MTQEKLTEASGAARPVVTPGAHARLTPLPPDQVELDRNGTLGHWQARNGAVTLKHCIAMLESVGTMNNFRRLAAPADSQYRGHKAADSDLYKTLEAIALDAGREASPGALSFLHDTVALLLEAQDGDGYVNSWRQGHPSTPRFSDLEHSHELYCAGHLIQAAIAIHRNLGRDDLLTAACRFADLLQAELGSPGCQANDGHPGVETALIELYRETDERRYLRLAETLIERRGRNGTISTFGGIAVGPDLIQDHLPVREATEPRGHVVRQF